MPPPAASELTSASLTSTTMPEVESSRSLGCLSEMANDRSVPCFDSEGSPFRVPQFVWVYRNASCREVAGRRKRAQLIGRKPPRQEAGIREVADPYRHVDPLVYNVDDLVVDPHVDRHVGIACTKCRQGRRDGMNAARQRNGDPQRARRRGPCHNCDLLNLLGVAQQSQRTFVQIPVFRCQDQRSGGAGEQRHAKALFKPLDAFADGKG